MDDDVVGGGVVGGDVVGGGRGPDGPRGGPPPWLRRVALVAAAGLAVLVLSRTGLLAADPAPRAGRATDATSGPAVTVDGPRLVARLGDRLLRAARGPAVPGTRLPDRLPPDAVLVPIPPGGVDVTERTPGPVVGGWDGQLFRADPGRSRWRGLGPAEAVVGAGSAPSRALVLRAGSLQEVDVATGATLDSAPFPGFDPDRDVAVGLLRVTDGQALLMRRRASGPGPLALAWPTAQVRLGARPAVLDLGQYGELLGIAGDWAAALRAGCPGPACRLDLLSVTRDQPRRRVVAPPPGWTFIAGPIVGRAQEALVPVERLTDGRPDGTRALARLVPAGDFALLVAGTAGVRLSAGLAGAADGSVYFLGDPPSGGDPEVRVWRPAGSSVAVPLQPAATFPRGARLVCVCG